MVFLVEATVVLPEVTFDDTERLADVLLEGEAVLWPHRVCGTDSQLFSLLPTIFRDVARCHLSGGHRIFSVFCHSLTGLLPKL